MGAIMDTSHRIPGDIANAGAARRLQREAGQQARSSNIDIEALKAAAGPTAARKFLHYFGAEYALLVAIDPSGRIKGTRGLRGADALAQAQALNERGIGIYYSVNTVRAGVVKKATKADIVGLRAIGFDFDYPGGNREQALATLDAKKAELETSPLPPSVLVSSGGGIQALWCLDEELPATAENIATVEAIGNAVRARYGGDDVANIDRVMRLPGFLNWPSAKKAERGQVRAEAAVIAGSGKTYALDAVMAAFPPAVRAAVLRMTPTGRSSGEANDDLAAGIGERDLNFDEVRSALRWMAEHPTKPFGAAAYDVWRDKVVFPLADIAVQHPEMEADCRALLGELVSDIGRNQQDNQKRFDEALRRTAKKREAGEALVGRASLFDAARALGWTEDSMAPSTAGHSATQAAAKAAALAGSPSGGPTAASGPRWGTPDGGPVNVFDPPLSVPMPLETLPDGVRNFVKRQAYALGCDSTALGFSALTTCAAAIDARTQVQLSAAGWRQRPILRTLLVGNPSTMKTPIIQAAVQPLVELDTAANRQLEVDRRAWRAQKAGKTGLVPPKPDLPGQFTIMDATHQKACEILSRRPRGSLMVRDEISGLFANCIRETDDRSFWLSSYDAATPHRKQKQATGRDDIESDIFVEVPALSMLGGIQPERLEEFVNLSVDGLLQRFIPIALTPAGEPDFDADTAAEVAHYSRLVKAVAVHGNYGDVRLSAGARGVRDEMMAYLQKLEKAAGGEANGGALASALGKVKGLWGRFALVLHIIEFEDAKLTNRPAYRLSPAFPTEVSEETANRATDLAGWAVRTLFLFYFSTDKFAKETKAIASSILTKRSLRFTLRDVMRSVNALKDNTAKEVADVMSKLEVAGWVVPVAPPKGMSTPREWQVDPAVHSQFAERARQEVERKSQLRELMSDSFAKRRRAKSS